MYPKKIILSLITRNDIKIFFRSLLLVFFIN